MNIDDCKTCASREMELNVSLTKVNETENVGHSDPIFISACSIHQSSSLTKGCDPVNNIPF